MVCFFKLRVSSTLLSSCSSFASGIKLSSGRLSRSSCVKYLSKFAEVSLNPMYSFSNRCGASSSWGTLPGLSIVSS